MATPREYSFYCRRSGFRPALPRGMPDTPDRIIPLGNGTKEALPATYWWPIRLAATCFPAAETSPVIDAMSNIALVAEADRVHQRIVKNHLRQLGWRVVTATDGGPPVVTYQYAEDASIEDKVYALAQKVYGASDVSWSNIARRALRTYQELGWGTLPVCMAKTHLSLSHNPALRGRPSGYTFEVSDVRASLGAGFIYPLAGSMVTLPGLPSAPRSLDVDDKGAILGL